jgi:hypothetical protein
MANQKVFCEDCQAELNIFPPPFPPQMCNSPLMSSVVMLNGRAECPKCGAKYVTQIQGTQVNLGFMKLKEESRIIKPTLVPPVGLK